MTLFVSSIEHFMVPPNDIITGQNVADAVNDDIHIDSPDDKHAKIISRNLSFGWSNLTLSPNLKQECLCLHSPQYLL